MQIDVISFSKYNRKHFLNSFKILKTLFRIRNTDDPSDIIEMCII